MDIYVDLDGERLKLYEDRQEFVDGRIRRRPNMTTSLGEKLEPGEEPEFSIARALEEELGVTSYTRFAPIESNTKSSMSPSFPGILSEHQFFVTG